LLQQQLPGLLPAPLEVQWAVLQVAQLEAQVLVRGAAASWRS
jgi:hypothetical protein